MNLLGNGCTCFGDSLEVFSEFLTLIDELLSFYLTTLIYDDRGYLEDSLRMEILLWESNVNAGVDVAGYYFQNFWSAGASSSR